MIRKNENAGVADGWLVEKVKFLEGIIADKERTIQILMDQQKKGDELSDVG